MKTLTNLQRLKTMINANDFEALELRDCSVQVYNLFDGEEYTNINKVEKVNGRYYIVDFFGRRALLSRYRNPEWLAGEFLDWYDREGETIASYFDALKNGGAVCVKSCHSSRLRDVVWDNGYKLEYVENTITIDQNGYVLESYTLAPIETAQDTTETAPMVVCGDSIEETAQDTTETAPIIDTITYISGGESYTLNRYEDGTVGCPQTGKTAPMTAQEWANLRHVLGDILGVITGAA